MSEATPSPGSTGEVKTIENPPSQMAGILMRLGPGLIIAGSIVGSGELIATTKTGAEAGFTLLWLILIGCVIKVFVQVEMGRYTVVNGKTTMDGLAEVPGPRIAGHGNWLTWYWALVFLATIGQVGGIVGGVGQALQISVPLTESGRKFNAQTDAETMYRVAQAELGLATRRAEAGDPAAQQRIAPLTEQIDTLGAQVVQDRLAAAAEQLEQMRAADAANAARLGEALQVARQRHRELGDRPDVVFDGSRLQGASDELRKALDQLGVRTSHDDVIWAVALAVVTAAILVVGRYGFIQSFATILVASFTFITVLNLFMLQSNDYWAVTSPEFLSGLAFRLPESGTGNGVATALATFGIIGVGANELIAYPYWCLEKGYARFTGPRDESASWAERARGWMRVMRWDAWCSMVVYTFATLAFYLLGAAILWRVGLNPAGPQMIRTLGVMYEPVFGSVARVIFLFGAFAVLYSTFFVATASLARVVPDAMRVMGIGPTGEQSYQRWVRGFSVLFPFMCVLAYTLVKSPAVMVLVGGVMQGVMLPMLAGAALYFRYQRNDKRLPTTRIWDLLLWVSAAGMLITGLWTVVAKLQPYLGGS